MEKKSINKFIYILHSFPPQKHQVGIRALEISKRLIKKNILPIIITQKIKNKHYLDPSLRNNIPSLIKIYRTFFFESQNKYWFFLIFNIFRFFFFLGVLPFFFLKIKKILKNDKSVKFILSSGPFFYTHIIGYFLKKKFNIPLVLEYRDPWSFNPYFEMKGVRLIEKIDFYIEKKILKSSDLIITVSSALNSFLKSKFPFIKKKPIYEISNGLNFIKIEEYPPLSKNQDIIFTFTGTLYEKRNIEPLMQIISELKKENFFNNFRFLLKIYGNYIGINPKKLATELNIDDIIFIGGYIPRFNAIKEIVNCDLAVHIGEIINYPTIAFKVWDYLSCRKKILYVGLENSYTAEFIKEYDLGIVLPINNLKKSKTALISLITEIKSNKFNTIISESVLEDFTWDKKAGKFFEYVIKNVIK